MSAGHTASKLAECGVTASHLKDIGWTPTQCKTIGFTAKACKDAGFSATDLHPLCKPINPQGEVGLYEVVIARRSGTLANGSYSFATVERVNLEVYRPGNDDPVITSIDIKYEDGQMPETANVSPSDGAVAHVSFKDEEDEQAEEGEDSEGGDSVDYAK